MALVGADGRPASLFPPDKVSQDRGCPELRYGKMMADLRKIEIWYADEKVVWKRTMQAGHWLVVETYDLGDDLGGFLLDRCQEVDILKSPDDAVQCAVKRALIRGWRWGFRDPWRYGTSEVDYSRWGKFRDLTGKFPSEAVKWIKDRVRERWPKTKMRSSISERKIEIWHTRPDEWLVFEVYIVTDGDKERVVCDQRGMSNYGGICKTINEAVKCARRRALVRGLPWGVRSFADGCDTFHELTHASERDAVYWIMQNVK
jgi:hypothetical protein